MVFWASYETLDIVKKTFEVRKVFFGGVAKISFGL